MKKLLCMLLVALMCMSMVTVASASTAPILLGTFKDVRFVDGTNLLRVTGSNGYGLADLNGNALTGTIYSNLTREGFIITCARTDLEGQNVWGALDLSGQAVIPFQYGHIDVCNDGWIVAMVLETASADAYDLKSWDGSSYFKVNSVDVYNVLAGTSMTLTRDQVNEYYAEANIINISDRASNAVTTYGSDMSVIATGGSNVYSSDYVVREISTFREDGRYGLKAADGTVILPATYASIYDFTGDYANVISNNMNGLINKQGVKVVDTAYEKIERSYNLPVDAEGKTTGYVALGYAAVELNGKMGYVDLNGNVTCEPKISESALENNGVSALYQDMEGVQHILAADGVDTVVTGINRINAMYYAAGLYYRISDADSNYGLIDWHGNEVFPCQLGSVSLSSDGRYALISRDYTTFELYDLGELSAYAAATSGAAPAAQPAASEPAADAAPAATAEPAAAEAPAADTSAVAMLIDSAKQLLNVDPAANAAAVVSLLETAVAQLPADDPSAALISSAITLLKTDAAANAPAVLALLG